MTLPTPEPGLVIRYAFLWSHEAALGRDEASKDRPCAVLLSATTQDRQMVVTVLPVTHRQPQDPDLSVELPAKTRRRLGLDGGPAWIILNEANRFEWPGPDLRAVPGDAAGSAVYGLLPAALYEVVREKWLAAFDARKARQTIRSDQ